jgi:AAA+ superfamily predicted ATPase
LIYLFFVLLNGVLSLLLAIITAITGKKQMLDNKIGSLLQKTLDNLLGVSNYERLKLLKEKAKQLPMTMKIKINH